jgi:hypothetical protein
MLINLVVGHWGNVGFVPKFHRQPFETLAVYCHLPHPIGGLWLFPWRPCKTTPEIDGPKFLSIAWPILHYWALILISCKFENLMSNHLHGYLEDL